MLLLKLLPAVLFLTAAAPAPTAADARLNQLFKDEWDQSMREHPEDATFLGYPGANDRFTDLSPPAMAARRRHVAEYLKFLDGIQRDALSDANQTSYDLAVRGAKEKLAGEAFPDELLAISQMDGIQQQLPQLLSIQPAATVADYEHIIARLNAVPKLVDQTMALLAEGVKRGVTPPQITLRDVPAQIQAQIIQDPMQSMLLKSFKSMPATIEPAAQARLKKAAVSAYQTSVLPAFTKLHSYFTETYLPHTRTSIGLAALPNGAAWYAYLVRVMTTTELTPAQVHQLGLSEVERIDKELDRVMKQAGFHGDKAAFGVFLRKDPRFFFHDKESLLAAYRDVAKRIDPQLPLLFGKLPRLTYGVEPVPTYSEKSQASAYYQSGSLEAHRAGTFFANTYALETRPSWEIEALTLHEAVPGHHLQIALAQEQGDLPEFRKNGGYTAFTEGWGLYAESLGAELGLYTDPYRHYGQLTYEMWRAVRLVVDTGMHALGWSRQQAIDFFRAHTSKSDHDIVVEVDRYITMPGQALAYKIGELKFQELRRYASAELGEHFNLRSFHDEVLAGGSLPLDVLEQRVKKWVAQQKVASSH